MRTIGSQYMPNAPAFGFLLKAMLVTEKIKQKLQEIRPHILKDGGDISFVSFINGTVTVRLHGACIGCPLAIFTLKLGIEEQLKQAIPEVVAVQALQESA